MFGSSSQEQKNSSSSEGSSDCEDEDVIYESGPIVLNTLCTPTITIRKANFLTTMMEEIQKIFN